MRWPWSSRRKKAPAAVGRHRRWAETAAPPAVPSRGGYAAPPRESSEKVGLGFADGSEVELGLDDPTALALQAVAGVLMRKEEGLRTLDTN